MYLAFTRSAFQTQFAYRSQVWSGLFGEVIVIFAKISIWTSVYAGAASVDGITLSDMITYALISGTVVAAWDWRSLLNEVGRSIRTGDVAVYLLKPLSYPLVLLSSECGNLGFRLLAVVIPTLAILSIIYGIQPPANAFYGAQFILFWLLSFFLLFLMAAVSGLLAFWLMTAFSLEWMLGALLSLLSGTFVPLWFFPEGLAAVVRFLPFAWVGYYPTAVYLGKLGPGETWTVLAFGLAWALVLSATATALWRRAARRIIVQGG